MFINVSELMVIVHVPPHGVGVFADFSAYSTDSDGLLCVLVLVMNQQTLNSVSAFLNGISA